MTGTEHRNAGHRDPGDPRREDTAHRNAAVVLRGFDPWGRPRSWSGTVERSSAATGSALDGTAIALADGRPLTVLRCPVVADRRRARALETVLDSQVRAGVRLARRYTPHQEESGYPDCFVQLVGYGIDTAEPFALTTRCPGIPARDGVRRMLQVEAKKGFAAELMAAVAALSDVDLVHGDLTPDTVFVDPAAAMAVRIGSFARAVGTSERRPGGERAHPGDDVRDAGRLLAVVLADASPDAPTPDLARVDWLETALEGVFHPDPRARPTARDVLDRLHVPYRIPPVRDRGEGLAAGRRRYDALRAPAPAATPESSTDEMPLPAARSAPALNPVAVAVGVLVVVIVVVVLVALKLAAS